MRTIRYPSARSTTVSTSGISCPGSTTNRPAAACRLERASAVSSIFSVQSGFPAFAEKRRHTVPVVLGNLFVHSAEEQLGALDAFRARRADEHRRVARERANHRARRLVIGHNGLGELVQLHPLAARGIAEELERPVHVEAEPLTKNPLRLLDADARAQGMLELLRALAPVLLAV